MDKTMTDTDSQMIKTVVSNALPEDTELLGEAVVTQIIAQRGTETKPVYPPGPQDFDLTSVLEVVKAAIELTVALIELYRILSKPGSKPSASELLAKVPEKAVKPVLKQEDKTRIAEEVLSALP